MPALPKLVVRPAEAGQILDCSQSYLYVLLRRGELESYEDGGARKITIKSIEDYVARRIAASRRKIRRPPAPPHKGLGANQP